MSLQVLLILIYFGLESNAKLPELVLKERTDLILYPADYYGMSTGMLRKPYLKKLGFNIFGNKRNDSVIFPADYAFASDSTKQRRKGTKKGGMKKHRLKQEQLFKRFDMFSTSTGPSDGDTTTISLMVKPTRSRLKLDLKPTPSTSSEYWDIWPSITRQWMPTLPPSRRTKTLSTYFPVFSRKTSPWRLVEWSRGPTGPDDIYYNFYKDYYVSDQVGKLNTYTGTPPKCHQQAYKVDGQVVNAPVHEELYNDAFLDYLKDRVQSYSTWSAFVKANPCFTKLSQFYGTTKILALFAARPLMSDPSERKSIELYRKDYMVLTERSPPARTQTSTATPPPRSTTTEEEYVLTQAEQDAFNEEEMFNILRQSDEQSKTSSYFKVDYYKTTSPTQAVTPMRHELLGSLRTRLISLRPKHTRVMLTNIAPPEEWTAVTEELSDPLWKPPGKAKAEVESDKLKDVQRFSRAKFDAKTRKDGYIICYECRPERPVDHWLPVLSDCHDMYERQDARKPNVPPKKIHVTRKCKVDWQNNLNRLGCLHRFLDVPSPYDERSCRTWPPSNPSEAPYHMAWKRFLRLEKMLRFTEDGCVSSPMASLTPFHRGIYLWVRYHVCVCSTHYCNAGVMGKINPGVLFLSLVCLLLIYVQ